jgi:hypothetical protein
MKKLAEKEFVAKTRLGVEFKFMSSIMEDGTVETEYPVEYAVSKEIKGYGVKFTVAQAKEIFGVTVPKDSYVNLADQNSWKEWLDKSKAIKEDIFEQEKAVAMRGKIVGYRYIRGCDTSDTNEFEYEFESEISYAARSYRAGQDAPFASFIGHFRKFDLKKYAKYAKETEAAMFSYGGYYFDKEALEKSHLIEEAKKNFDKDNAEKEAKKQANKAEKEAKKQAALKEAKETGKNVKIYGYMIDCQDEDEDCSFDSVAVCATPDGQIKEFVSHCW